MNSKDILSELLSYYKMKVDNDLCMPEEIESAKRVLMENLEIYGTIDDLSQFYGKSKDAVNSVIKRRMYVRPKRNVVLYPFHLFSRLVPDKWRIKDKK